jgi:hypothetical protein
MELTDEWIAALNEEFSKDHIPHSQRPFLAWLRWGKAAGRTIEFRDPDVKRIFAWFRTNSPVGAHEVGSFFTGLFYFDAHLWPIEIPIVHGTVTLNGMDSLRTMPDNIKRRLESDPNLYMGFGQVWCDCIDYSIGIEGLIKHDNGSFWQELLRSGHQQLLSTVTLLQGNRPNPKGAEPARMATEMFLKAFIANKTGMTDAEARKQFSHNLEKALEKCLEIDPKSDLYTIRSALGEFPEISERYTETEKTLWELWRMYGMAQYSGVTVVRSLSGYDSRGHLYG